MSVKDVAHNKVDIILKALGNDYRDKSFAAYGLDLPKIINFRPTDLPLVTGRERFADHIFDLADGSHVIVDYESQYRKMNFIKYGHYATKVLHRDMTEKGGYRLRFIVVYTGDVNSAPSEYTTDCLTIRVENVFLARLDSQVIYEAIMGKITAGQPLSDVEQMRLIILPLTAKGKDAKIALADKAINAAVRIREQSVRSFVLSGMSVAGAGFMTEEQDEKILEVLKMTRLGEMIQKEIDEKSEKSRMEGRAEGISQGILSSVRSLMETMSWPLDKAMDALKIPPAEQPKFAAMINV